MHDESPNPLPLDPVEPEIRSALHAAYGSPGAQVDWDALAAGIDDAAAFRLAQRRPRGGWQHAAAGWSRRAVPAAVAASLILALGIALAPGITGGDPAVAADTVMLEEVMAVAASDGLPTDVSLASVQDAFLAVMLNGDD